MATQVLVAAKAHHVNNSSETSKYRSIRTLFKEGHNSSIINHARSQVAAACTIPAVAVRRMATTILTRGKISVRDKSSTLSKLPRPKSPK
jgi:hypothetical protein